MGSNKEKGKEIEGVKVSSRKRINRLVSASGEKITDYELKQEIQKAEEGRFISVEESMKRFESWMEERKNNKK